MRRMALCAASMLLLGCLAGCSTTPQNSQEQGNPVIKEEISQPLGGSEALGNSEDSSALSAADKEKMFAPYEQYGMTYDAVKDELTYNGNLVRWFEDYYPISNNETAGIDFLNENGTVDVYAVRDLESFSKAADGSVDPAGKLIGLKEFTQQEFDARDIEALKNSTSVAMAGTPLEDSETAKLVAEYEAFGVTYDAEKDQWYFNGEEVRYFRDVLTSNGESLTSGKFRGEMRTLGSGVGTIDILLTNNINKIVSPFRSNESSFRVIAQINGQAVDTENKVFDELLSSARAKHTIKYNAGKATLVSEFKNAFFYNRDVLRELDGLTAFEVGPELVLQNAVVFRGQTYRQLDFLCCGQRAGIGKLFGNSK